MPKPVFQSAQKKVIFFDVNGTLLLPRDSFKEAFYTLWEETTGRWSEPDGPPAELIWNEYKTEFQKRSDAPYRRLSTASRMQESLTNALEKAGIRWSRDMSAAFVRKAEARAMRHPVTHPDAGIVLKELSKRFSLAVISNGNKDKRVEQLTAAGLLPPLRKERIFTSSQFGTRKPELAMFRHALSSMEIQPEQGIMIGDSWRKDILGAARAGLDAIWLNPAYTKKNSRIKAGRKEAIVIRSLAEIAGLFD